MKSLRLFPLILLSLVLASATAVRAETVKLHRLLTGAALKMGGQFPQRIIMNSAQPAVVTKVPSDLVAPLYGVVTLGPPEDATRIAVLVDDPDGPAPRLFVDANADGDLTNDPAPDWKQQPYKGADGKDYKKWEGGATVQVRYGAKTLPVRLDLARYDRNDASRALYNGALVYYTDTGCEGDVILGGRRYHVMLADNISTGDFRGKDGPVAGVSFLIDVNANGTFDARGEKYDIAKPFNIKGTTYEIANISATGETFDIVKSSHRVPEILPPPDLQLGRKALPFTAKTLNGQTIRFPSDYKGKLVLLQFWASWCPDCRAELPNWIKTYAAFRNQDVAWLGISLDKEKQGPQLADFTKTNGMAWPQIYDGKHWEAAIAQLYFVRSIPTTYLIDGDTGVILAGRDELIGPRLAESLTKALAKRR